MRRWPLLIVLCVVIGASTPVRADEFEPVLGAQKWPK